MKMRDWKGVPSKRLETHKVNGVLKMVPTPHHKTAYRSRSTCYTWYKRHFELFCKIGEDMGFTLSRHGADIINKPEDLVGFYLQLESFQLGVFKVEFNWAPNGASWVRVVGSHTDETHNTYFHWREGKPASHNDGRLGNWFIKLVRLNWVKKNRPSMYKIKIGSEITFSGDPSGSGQKTRAKVLGKGGEWGKNYLKVELLEERGVRSVLPVGAKMEVHYENIIYVKNVT